jgi:hypothetical protein
VTNQLEYIMCYYYVSPGTVTVEGKKINLNDVLGGSLSFYLFTIDHGNNYKIDVARQKLMIIIINS